MAPVRERLELRQPGNWAWPKGEQICWHFWREKEPDIPAWVMARVPGRRTIVQAGGNAGFYVREYAAAFERVITFEPHAVNFHALVRNVDDDNTFFYRAFVGEQAGEAPLASDIENGGGHFLWPDAIPYGAVGPETMVPVMQIDALGLSQVDLIHLDIEGYEWPALRGALATIARCKPWLAMERRDECLSRYAFDHADFRVWLTGLGYELADTHKHEELYRPKP